MSTTPSIRRAVVRKGEAQDRTMTQQLLYDMVHAFLSQKLYRDVDYERIAARAPIMDGDVQIGQRALHELRMFRLKFSEVGIVGQLTQHQFAVVLMMSFAEGLKAIQERQPSCQWQVVAAEIEQFDLSVVDEVPFTGTVFGEGEWTPEMRKGQPGAINRRSDFVKRKEYRCMAYIVVADVGEGQLQDPHSSHADGEEKRSWMSRYKDTRNLGHMGVGAFRERELCEELLENFVNGSGEIAVEEEITEVTIPAGLNVETGDDLRLENVVRLSVEGNSPSKIARILTMPKREVDQLLDSASDALIERIKAEAAASGGADAPTP